ncbi:uncharacterized protein F5Z01DRAFT_265940 [Emericellopsis atlantica]|uniref:Peroxisomal membrane protein PEX14 n=1 Tax=Emericellopsis atlantica TaxID=2614577 RepID=A0A9P8CLU5_9HYPO|nr:uncharacterized protein F5Z01DRAFT_265940 [Emericellopsis atlantica]KAG9251773.1 hypothetical protein F5Z01DRAFT_265940 [Emericellopsis atlantica]
MGDADADDKPNDGIPEWQRKNETEDNAEDSLAVARRFLQDEHVKNESRDKKVAFLKAKGIDDSDIEALVDESPPSPTESAATEVRTLHNPHQLKWTDRPQTNSTPSPTPASETTPPRSEPSSPTANTEPTSHPPVVTYPEFLTTPSQPPPLVTTARLLTTLQITTLVSTLVVGTSKFVLGPMLESLTASRVELHDDVSGQLDKMLSLLEGTVSTVPTTAKPKTDADEDEDDPSEMFHRDVGTQTFLPIASSTTTTKASPSEIQATRLQGFTKSLGEIKEGLRSQSDDLSDIKTLVDVFRDDLDALTYKSPVEMDFYSGKKKAEPDDETKKVRDNIRRIKGALLSTRSFPTSAR